jgi:2,3,4,5-tetrahydropyridine-2-carboxylate N-succinyltransferase
MDVSELQTRIDALVADPSGVRTKKGKAVDEVIAALDEGLLRVAEFDGESWVTHAWIKHAILLYFARMDSEHVGPDCAQKDAARCREFSPTYYDKVPTKRNYKKLGVRCVPGGIARYGSFLGRGAILMPGFVNIGAYVDEGSMVDTWATVGSCAQIGKNVHLAGGVGIGGVLEPAQASPVIVEDGAFIGSRCIVVEGVRVGAGAVLGAGTVITGSTSIVDVRGSEPRITKGYVEPRSVVIPGTMPKTFAAGEYGVPVALVIGTRSESTDMKTSLNAALRDFEVAV